MSASERPRRARRHRRRGGFTLVEAMLSMVILSVGVLGVMSMQGATTNAAKTAQDFTQAQAIGERMMELIRLDALRWRAPGTTGLSSTQIMKVAAPPTEALGSQGAWSTIPNGVINATMAGSKVDRNFMPRVDNWALGFRYCVYFRLAWANPPMSMRVDVRVAWARDNANQSYLADCLANADNVHNAQLPQSITDIRSVSMATTVMQNVF